ncbi:MAG: hypothetical protein ACOC0V_00480 [Oceanicaulis sp.]
MKAGGGASVGKIVGVVAFCFLVCLISGLAILFYLSWLWDRDENWSEDPDRLIAKFDRSRPFECPWCELEEGQQAYLLRPSDIAANSKVCVFGRQPASGDPDAILAHGMVLGYEHSWDTRGRFISAGSAQHGVVILRAPQWASFVTLIFAQRVDLRLRRVDETECRDAANVALVHRGQRHMEYELVLGPARP